MAKEYDCYIRYLREDIEDREGEEIKVVVRDCERYVLHPVIAKIYRTWGEKQDKLVIRDPLGKAYRDDPWGLEIIKEEDEEKLIDPDFFKCGL
jgi:hypothetical protein